MNSEALPGDLAQPVTAALEQLRAGGPVVVTDAIRQIGVAGIAGSRVTPTNVNFLIGQCRGIIYAGASRAQLNHLRIGHQHGADVMRSRVYVAVDAIQNVTTGVSASDRAITIATILDPESSRARLRTPGHVLPTVIDDSGQLESFYFNEAVQYLVGLAGLGEGLALSGILAEDGSIASVDALHSFAAEHGAPCLDIADVLRARRALDGWPGPWPGQQTAGLAHLRTDVAITAFAAHERHEQFPVEVLPFCAPAHALRAPGACRDRLDAALAALERHGAGAVVLAWPAGQPIPTTTGDAGAEHDHHVNPGLARLIAAELAAAQPERFAIR
ncbi:MAG: 3,4-dihydroxy 2-butanone 4-phosphate synthase / cyclohydrolase [Micromonosporaceae bacterium]|nr:3,4-dihydroxy 2-butanone 4-phosphate synthase / cyclohydrolase [Micromonosporaceae bacterium]